MMSPAQKELLFKKGQRKHLFCGDSKGAESLYNLVHQAMEDHAPFDFLVIENESDSFLHYWFNQQKMGTYLYVSGEWEFVNRIKHLALEAGFSEYEMQLKVLGRIRKKLICCKCHGVNDVCDEWHSCCVHCGLKLEVSNHYSRRLEAYLGYASI
jgi:dimethylamine monooxygenase subunit C